MARPSKVPGKADNWQICLFLQKIDLSMLDNIAIIIVFIGLSFIAEISYTRNPQIRIFKFDQVPKNCLAF